MKKKIILAGFIIILLVFSYYAGETPSTESEVSEKQLTQNSAQLWQEEPAEVVPEEQKAIEDEKNRHRKKEENAEEDVGKEKAINEPGMDKSASMASESTTQTEQEPKATIETTAKPTTDAEKPESKESREEKEESKLSPIESPRTMDEPDNEKNICTLSVRCDAILENMDKLTEGKQELVPKNGVIYEEQAVKFTEEESVFDVLYRELRENKIHFEFVKTPAYHSVYIEGIGNLYEFDCGDYSGWMYRVNGVKPNVGCSQYQVKKGDVIVVSYTCNFLKER